MWISGKKKQTKKRFKKEPKRLGEKRKKIKKNQEKSKKYMRDRERVKESTIKVKFFQKKKLTMGYGRIGQQAYHEITKTKKKSIIYFFVYIIYYTVYTIESFLPISNVNHCFFFKRWQILMYTYSRRYFSAVSLIVNVQLTSSLKALSLRDVIIS